MHRQDFSHSHSYTLGTEETVKWGNSFKQTAPGRLLSMPLVIQQRINALLPVSCPGHITLGVTWSDFGSREQTCAVTLLWHSCSPSSFRRSPLAQGEFLSQTSLHGADIALWDRWLLHETIPSLKLLHIHWKIEGNCSSGAAPKRLWKKFSPKAYLTFLPHLTTHIYEYRRLLLNCVFFICLSPFSESASVT